MENKIVATVVSIVLFLIVWSIASSLTTPLFLPSIGDTVGGLTEMANRGLLLEFSGVTLYRVMVGWLVGCGVAIPLGWVIGSSKFVEKLVTPEINFFRAIPPIAWATLIVIWLGFTDMSRILLVAYATLFIVVINCIIGVHQVEEIKIRAAKCLGASRTQLFTHVQIPSSIPFVYSGMLTALGASFMTIVAAEMLTASTGIGYLLWVQRLYFRLDWVFACIVLLGVLGVSMDFAFKKIGRFALKKYNVK